MHIFYLNFNKNKNMGFTLVETLIAVSIFTISILALMSVLTSGISNTSYAKQKIAAGYLAQEGIEYIRNMRDTYVLYTSVTSNDWAKFKTKLTPCNVGSECGIDSSVPTTNNAFIFKCTASNKCNLYLHSNGSYDITNSNGVDSGFVRKVWMVPVSANEVQIFSSVSWVQGSGSYSTVLKENLFNWIQ